ncbi:uncharacterized protein L3040_006440 [Drepanopeziza brunnea f. sp. 'multigermtubi']|uniref:uncharacterized protein n=1 Tax=Drepanopeziza brunnea f. sp. 'multigermtubi' TaxID=698441 RepID=UPI00239EFE27|nr:hypothetical protein L3040_006440 [Drepanopeziza brunnea f. sp. 'multigermtubi']
MDDMKPMLEPFTKATRSLGPYIKQRHEVAQIRRILASHLSSHVSQDGDHSLSRPISLVDTTCNVDIAPHGVRGLQKEYLRCVRANVKAQRDYAEISKQHRLGRDDEYVKGLKETSTDDVSCMESFLELVSQRQKYERLRIVQDYMDALAQKPAASAEHLDPQLVLQDVETLPKVPSEVLNSADTTQGLSGVNIEELVDQLAKSVLRAKMLLKREQILLGRVKAENSLAPGCRGSRLEAVGMTRSALINWIEAELSRAGDSSPESEIATSTSPDKRGKQFIDSELSSIHRQYSRYTKARQSLINAATGRLDATNITKSLDEQEESPKAKEETYAPSGIEVTYPYLENMVSVLNEQKAMIQQKSHLCISLSKQLKEANQGLDRLADESHLLPAHPMPSIKKQRHGLEGPISFGDEISNHEKPDSSLRAREWAHAAQSAGHSTKIVVSEKLDEGGVALEEAGQTLLELKRLLGADIVVGERFGKGIGELGATEKSKDIWAVLDGNLGVIKGDGSD